MGKITVIGASNWDMFTYCARIPVVGETIKGNDFKTSYGGKASNQAVQCALLGSECVGDDMIGKNTIENFKSKNIDIKHVGLVKDVPSGCATIIVDSKGNNNIIIVGGSNDKLDQQDVIDATFTIQKSSYLLCQLEVSLETTFKALKVAKQPASSCKTILNLSPVTNDPLLMEMMEFVDILLLNEVELIGIAKKTEEKIDMTSMSTLHQLVLDSVMNKYPTIQSVIVTLGENGCLLVSRDYKGIDQYTHVPVTEKVVAVDTTGAGDSFTGALAHYLDQSFDMAESISKASRVSAISVTRYGTQTSYPSKSDL
ncbi:hypothetical protein DFA_05983 [Cavenderia fasciculata]|uniref:Ribokinase n=1 Tax=Cavenderia fasciculata TaxID=261658 RepID=F4PJS3_CACFS|nr:uncharacterized protein DFA_05983 [Cavenderia fasciculata]EGG23847.1 hypothetical protein DFA_05983 [Cavenderia fasciculata]|eukprot:XP_004361698.1 hypothetical protein DFA_05983 [Cavenderia fasciculata]